MNLLNDILINDSDYALTNDEINLLSRGLTFTPTRRPRIELLDEDLERLRRKLNLRAAWPNDETAKVTMRSKLSDVLGSDWIPPETIAINDPIWTEFRNTWRYHVEGHNLKPNLPPNWREIWDGLTSNPKFFLTQADKGGRMVLWPREAYEKEASRQLEDVSTYREIPLQEATKEMATLHWTRKNLAGTLVSEGSISKIGGEKTHISGMGNTRNLFPTKSA